MFIELVDALRCPNTHEESWLVAAADQMVDRHIVTGTLGCPVCSAEFPIRDGVVDFRRQRDATISAGPAPDSSPDAAMKLAALLGLSDAQGFAVLLGAWGALGNTLAASVDTPLILADPPADVTGSRGISVIRCDGELPLATGAARAIALDGSDTHHVHSAMRVVRAGGRLVAPVQLPVPDEARELARDDTLWVAERGAPASKPVTLHVRRG